MSQSKRRFKELREIILRHLAKGQITINQLASDTGINWKTVDNHLTFLVGKGLAKEVFSSKFVRIFEITAYMREVFISMSERKIESPFVFIREDGKPYTSKNLNAIWHEAEEKAGIRCKLYNAVRHSLGCQLLDQGEDMDLIREILGHTKAEMTRRYAKRKVTKSTEALSRRRKKIIKFKVKDEN